MDVGPRCSNVRLFALQRLLTFATYGRTHADWQQAVVDRSALELKMKAALRAGREDDHRPIYWARLVRFQVSTVVRATYSLALEMPTAEVSKMILGQSAWLRRFPRWLS